MNNPLQSAKELERLRELDSYDIVDSLPEDEYDNIAKLASYICETPISLITMVDRDRQWFKSHPTVEITESPREYSFCSYAIEQPNSVIEIQDLRNDTRFSNNPFVVDAPNVVFYAGSPLVTSTGNALGTLCVLDTKPRTLTEIQKKALQSLSQQVITLLELRQTKKRLELTAKRMLERNTTLEQFAKVAAHDLKSPLASMTAITELLSTMYSAELNQDAQECIFDLQSSAQHLSQLIDDILEHSQSEKILSEQAEDVSINEIVQKVILLQRPEDKAAITTVNCDYTIFTNTIALEQILLNLVSNSLKYNNNPEPKVIISFTQKDNFYEFSVEDNGPGIEVRNQAKIFDAFAKLQNVDKYGKPSTGIGLNIVYNLVHGLGGTIILESEPQNGAKFTFTIAK